MGAISAVVTERGADRPHDGLLRWRCRRGMRELDDLLLAYLEHRYEAASESDKQAFRSLLELSDPELISYLLYKKQPAAEIQGVVQHIRDRNHA